MKKLLTALALTMSVCLGANAQRFTDQLDRGLVAVKTTSGVYCSWRIQADEYYDTQYNIYRDGTKLNSSPLSVSNYIDAAGTASSTYTVRAVVNGVEQTASAAAAVWSSFYKEIAPQLPAELKCTYVPNDACCADVDGDGQVEILLKWDNSEESAQLYPKDGPTVNGTATGEYSLLTCLKMDGTVLWWVNCGPNMGDFQNNEQNIVGYDWDMDGKAEVVMRLEEGSQVHMADGTTYIIGADGQNGTSWTNYRTPKGDSSVEWFTYYGKEFLYYCEGATGKPYLQDGTLMDYPCKRLEAGETDLNKAWGDGYGHRSNKHFFGAPYLDGKHPSMFIGRGIYTRHKFYAFDVNPTTHALTERWHWTNSQAGSPWYGQGYHNYAVVDVDWDGRDEIVWGSMVIDDNGLGLSTTGLGHGDSQHHGDLNPYVHGQEGFFCNEDAPSNNYRDLTTSKIYYRVTATNDDGRAMAGNFSNDFPGAMGITAHDYASPISCVTNAHLDGKTTEGVTQNFRIYWDGDLQEESFNGSSTRNSTGTIYKYGQSSALQSLTGSLTNNDTKATPCYQGDIFGDWREEVMMRTSDNKIRIYTTTIPTEWRNYSLWYDHQYRNAMVWQPCGYNQAPHASYFLGELEGITIAPPPLTTTGREEVGTAVTTSLNGKHALLDTSADATVNIAEGASPAIFTDNVPSWVQGSAPSECTTKETEITYTYYTHTLTGAAFTGSTRLVKQGDGTLVLPDVTQTYTGNTDIWAGKLVFNGTMQNSPVWLNRFAELNSDGGTFKSVTADYASVIRPGGTNVGTITIGELSLGFGARVEFDVNGTSCDKISATTISLEKKTWDNGPQYNAPVFAFTSVPAAGTYTLLEGTLTDGSDINAVTVEGLEGYKYTLTYADGKIQLTVNESRAPQENVTWTGSASNVWDNATSANWSSSDNTFVKGDDVIFNDNASTTTVNIAESVTPASVLFKNDTKAYTLTGDGAIEGDIALTLNGSGTVNINNANKYTGGTYINNGTLVPGSLANTDGLEYGALGGSDNGITFTNAATLKLSDAVTTSHPILLGQGGGTINTAKTLVLNGGIKTGTGTDRNLYKTGAGTLQLNCTADYDALYINQGTVYDFNDSHFSGKTVYLNGANVTLQALNSTGGSAETDNVNIVVPSGMKGIWYPDGRCNYTGKLTGDGTITIYSTFVRCAFNGDWSAFNGTINAKKGSKATYEPQFDFNSAKGMPNATLNVDASFTSSIPFNTNGKSFSIGALTGSGYISSGGNFGSATNTLTIGTKNTDFSFTGTINGSNVVKAGTGVWTIASEDVLANAKSLKIIEGAVKLNKAAATKSMTAPTITYLQDAGELRGQGYIYGINILNGGVLRAGTNTAANQTSNVGIITVERNVNAEAGSHIYVNRTAADSLSVNAKTGVTSQAWAFYKVNGNATLNGTIHVTYKTAWTPALGDYVRVLDCNGTISGTPEFDLQALPDGLGWDTSEFLSTGVIKVGNASGITDIDADGIISAAIYAVNGQRLATITTTRNSLQADMKAAGMAPGLYVVRAGLRSMTVLLK